MDRRAKILIVDDEHFNVDSLAQELEDLGYDTISAENGQQALDLVASDSPDLILLDILMPVMDGFTACRLLKQNPASQLIPVVIMTALGAKEDRIKGIEAGADDFLTKPVDERELIARVQTALKHKHTVDRRLQEQATHDAHQSVSPALTARTTDRTATLIVQEKIFRQEGEYWTIAYQGSVFRLKDATGLHYLATLLRSPHRQIHALDLVALKPLCRGARSLADQDQLEGMPSKILAEQGVHISRLTDAGSVLDAKTKLAYKKRLQEIQEELTRAEATNDTERALFLEQEKDSLNQELLSGIGYGGQDRRVGSPAERARVNVTRAIKVSLQKLADNHPALGQHLADSIKTGTYCSYAPELNLPSTWSG